MNSSTDSELESLAGLTSAKRVVRGLAQGSPVQSVLFYGVAGSGKRRLAKALIRAWLCVDPQPGACGKCAACGSFERNRAVDVLWLEPRGKSRWIKLGAISPVQNDEEFPVSAQEFLRTQPLAARAKVVVFEDAERMMPGAANALLKILEEPPPYARFILLTEAAGLILPTVRSRCLAVACELPESLDPEMPDWVRDLAGGAPGRAETILDQAVAYEPIVRFAESLPSRPRGQALVAADEFAKLADALEPAAGLNARAANAEALRTLAIAIPAESDDLRARQLIIEAHRRILGNANPSSVFDALFAAMLG